MRESKNARKELRTELTLLADHEPELFEDEPQTARAGHPTRETRRVRGGTDGTDCVFRGLGV